MAPKMSMNLKQTQSLTMTPQLQQAIKLLTLTHLEMTNVISKEMVDNPMLEEMGGESTQKEIERHQNQTQEAKSDDFSGPELMNNVRDDFDWNKYAESHNVTSSTPYTKEGMSKDDAPNYENMVSMGSTLTEHLEWQLRMETLTDAESEFAMRIIHNLNEEGFLEETFDTILKNCSKEINKEDAYRILDLIQNLDPVGCGAHDLQESLLIQARALEEHAPVVELIIRKHFDLLMRRDYPTISKEIGIDEEKVKEAEIIIHNFHPKPGRLINPAQTQYVVPDIFVKDIGGELNIKLNDEGVPRLKVSKLYQSLLKAGADDATNDYVQDKLRAAMWLIKSIENRQRTIEKVAHAIVKYQPEFFKKGAAFLKPMILKDIANEIGMHESTVSRVTTNKYMHTSLGTFELKFFFNAGIGGKNGGIDTTSETLKLKIKELIDNEEATKPLSDQKISEILKKKDLVVARRTVAKYREALNILPSSKRKKKVS